MTASSNLQHVQTAQTSKASTSTAALTAGIGLLIMVILAMWGELYTLPKLIVPDDATATVNNIMANETLFRLNIISWVVILICDVLVGWGLYVFLKPVNRNLSLLMGWFRLAYTVIHGAALLNFAFVLRLLNGSEYTALFSANQLYGFVALFLEGRQYGFMFGLLFFGVHLCILGYMVFKSGYMPKFLGILLFLGGIGYLTDNTTHLLLRNYGDYQAIFQALAFFMAIGELSLMVWLLWKGTKVQPVGNDQSKTA